LNISTPAQASLVKPGAIPFPDKDRYWLKNPYKSSLTEYIQTDTVPLTETALNRVNEELFGNNAQDSQSVILACDSENNLTPPPQINKVPKRVRFPPTIPSDSEDSDVTKTLKRVRFSHSDSEDSDTTNASNFEFSCRCGARGDGHSLSNGENCVQCDTCEKWSHVACQRGRVNSKELFVCDECSGAWFRPLPVVKR
jgi:hypothetical protein